MSLRTVPTEPNGVTAAMPRATPPHHRHRPWSLAARLATGFGLTAFALLVTGLGYSYVQLSDTFAREDAQFLHEEIAEIASLLRNSPDAVNAMRRHLERESEAHLASPLHVRVTDGATGATLAETPAASRLLPTEAAPGPALTGSHDATEKRDADELPLRVVSETLHVDDRVFIVQMGLDRTFEQRLLSRYRMQMLAVLAVGLVASAGTGYGVARSGLRPLPRMARAMERVGVTTLHERIGGSGKALPRELSALATSFNGMLQRLEEAFARLSRSSSDIAHELRTPIHNIRGTIEVTLNRPRSPQELQAMLAPCLDECQRLGRLIDNMLFIARAEDPRARVVRQRIDVTAELEKVRELFNTAAAEAGVTLGVAPSVDDGRVNADLDRLLLQQALCNLVDNALAHTPRGGRVTLDARRDNHDVHIQVADTGCGIAPEHLPLIFDRLHRVDPSRSRQTGGSGLGLAIVKSIATLHGGTVTARSNEGTGTQFHLVLPSR
jgi:two-component system heavy metal sensor histidine kinase CusS